jgi:hypothetical protein
MGKKSDAIKPASASAESPVPLFTTHPPAAGATKDPEAVATAGNGAGAAKKTAKSGAKKKAPAKKTVTFTIEEIQLRAYFISEHRHQHGIHGDPHSDWVEAERQLKAERKKTAAKKKKKPASRTK